MTYDELKEELLASLELPFSLEQVESIESNCGSVWITLKNGKVYSLQVVECEPME